jgi:hypothetical protein
MAMSLHAFGMGDGAARISGHVVDASGEAYGNCRLELLDTDNLETLVSRNVGSPFLETMLMAPGAHPYKLRVTCQGSAEVFTSGLVSLGDLKKTYHKPFELGRITLRRQ